MHIHFFVIWFGRFTYCFFSIQIPVIHHFLEDIEKHQRSSGFCNLGVKWQPIESEHMRQYFRLNRDQTGILISKTLKLSCSHGIIQRGDVMMAIDGSRIADDGTVCRKGFLFIDVYSFKTIIL